MAKKYENQLTKQYIPIVNNSEMYKLSKALTDKDLFKFSSEQLEATAQLNDSKKDILIQITEYEVMKDPSIIMHATKHEEIVTKVKERLNNLDQDTSDMYKILWSHWMNYKAKDGLENAGRAYIEIKQIHFGYKGLVGTNQESGIPELQYKNYIKAIDILKNTNVKIDITKETNIAYDKIKSLKWGAIEGVLINNVIWTYNNANTKRIGLWFDLGLIGKAYSEHVVQINKKYPTTLLQLDGRQHFIVKNIGNYLCYLHRCNENTKNKQTTLNLYNLMGESQFAVIPPRIQQYIDRFIKNLNKVKKMLMDNKIISDIIIPEQIYSKNYKETQIVIKWLYE